MIINTDSSLEGEVTKRDIVEQVQHKSKRERRDNSRQLFNLSARGALVKDLKTEVLDTIATKIE